MSRRALAEEMKQKDVLRSPKKVRDYLSLKFGNEPREIFMVLFFRYTKSRSSTRKYKSIFEGTLTQASVYPREIVKRALHHNAASVIFAHNHKSGIIEPIRADEILTKALKSALDLVDISVLDHFIVAGNETMSFAERGLL